MAGKSLKELKNLLGGRLQGDGSVTVKDVATLEEGGPGEIAFLFERKYLPLLGKTQASAAVVDERFREECGAGNFIFVSDPRLALAKLLSVFRPEAPAAPGKNPMASVHPAASLGSGVSIGAFSVVEEGAEIGTGAVLHPFVYVGKGAKVGDGTLLYPGVVVREGCIIGKSVIIHSNSVIGSDGFGYAMEGGRYVKIPQKGIVRVEDDVEIGACVTIDRATLGETRIGRGAKIDNLVQIAHNVRVGEDTVIVSQTGIAGSTSVGNRVQIGGQVGVADHISIGDGAVVAAKSGVARDMPSGEVWSGSPAIPHGDWLRAQLVFAKLPEMKKKIEKLEKRLKKLEEQG